MKLLNSCLLCGQPTDGSIGAAGYYWSRICPTCKATEDAALALNIKAQAEGMRFVFDKLFGLGEPGAKDLDRKTLPAQGVITRGD